MPLDAGQKSLNSEVVRDFLKFGLSEFKVFISTEIKVMLCLGYKKKEREKKSAIKINKIKVFRFFSFFRGRSG